MRLLIRQPWARAFRSLDFWIPLGSQCTMTPPMQTVMAKRAALAERLGAVELGFCFGLPTATLRVAAPRSLLSPTARRERTPPRMQC